MMLMILNLDKQSHNAQYPDQLMNIGMNDTRVSSMRPYIISNTTKQGSSHQGYAGEILVHNFNKSWRVVLFVENRNVRVLLKTPVHLLPVCWRYFYQGNNGSFARLFSYIVIKKIFPYICHRFFIGRLIITVEQFLKLSNAVALKPKGCTFFSERLQQGVFFLLSSIDSTCWSGNLPSNQKWSGKKPRVFANDVFVLQGFNGWYHLLVVPEGIIQVFPSATRYTDCRHIDWYGLISVSERCRCSGMKFIFWKVRFKSNAAVIRQRNRKQENNQHQVFIIFRPPGSNLIYPWDIPDDMMIRFLFRM